MRTANLTATAIGLVSLLPGTALAAWPEDVTLGAMTEFDGVRVDNPEVLTAAYEELMLQLGSVIAPKPLAPAETPGAFGFDVSIGNSFLFLPKSADGGPTVWERAHESNDPSPFKFVPSLTVRKGLPFSLEVGASAAWLGLTRQGLFSVFGRASIVEGYKPAPDITLRASYTGMVGTDDLELGVLDLGVTLGSTYAFGSLPGIRQAQISPYLDVAALLIQAAPVLDTETGEAIFGAAAPERVGVRETFGPVMQFGGGLHITNSTVTFRLAGTYALSGVAGLSIGMGFTY